MARAHARAWSDAEQGRAAQSLPAAPGARRPPLTHTRVGARARSRSPSERALGASTMLTLMELSGSAGPSGSGGVKVRLVARLVTGGRVVGRGEKQGWRGRRGGHALTAHARLPTTCRRRPPSGRLPPGSQRTREALGLGQVHVAAADHPDLDGRALRHNALLLAAGRVGNKQLAHGPAQAAGSGQVSGQAAGGMRMAAG